MAEWRELWEPFAEMREQIGLTASARLTGLSESTVDRLAKGQCTPQPRTLRDIEKGLVDFSHMGNLKRADEPR